jgi:hypothetical protein
MNPHNSQRTPKTAKLKKMLLGQFDLACSWTALESARYLPTPQAPA